MGAEPLPKAQLAGVLVALGLLFAVVAASSRAHLFGDAGPVVGAGVRRTFTDTLFYLLILYVIAIATLIVWALWPDERLPAGPVQRRSLFQTMVVPLLFTLVLGLALALRVRTLPGRGSFNGFGASFFQPGAPRPLTPLSGGADGGGLDWLALAIVAGLAAAGASAFWNRRRLRRRVAPGGRALAASLEEAVADGLQELKDEADPRRAVIAAYSRMESALARGGFGRRAPEAPFEYLARVLAAAGLESGPATRLTDLFEVARFSEHPMTGPDRSSAVAALQAIRAEIDGIEEAAAERV